MKVNGFLDAAILKDFLRDHAPSIDWKHRVGRLVFALTPITWMEVMSASLNSNAERQAAAFLKQFAMIYPTQDDLDWAMRQFVVHHIAHGVSWIDCLVAAPCLRLQLPLFTMNLDRFVPLLASLARQPY